MKITHEEKTLDFDDDADWAEICSRFEKQDGWFSVFAIPDPAWFFLKNSISVAVIDEIDPSKSCVFFDGKRKFISTLTKEEVKRRLKLEGFQ